MRAPVFHLIGGQGYAALGQKGMSFLHLRRRVVRITVTQQHNDTVTQQHRNTVTRADAVSQ